MLKGRKAVKLTLSILVGIIVGLVYFYLYGVVLPDFLIKYGFTGGVTPITKYKSMLVLFILLGIMERTLPPAPSAAVQMVSKLVGASYLYFATSGGHITGVIHGLVVRVDITPILYTVILFSLIIGFLEVARTIFSSKT